MIEVFSLDQIPNLKKPIALTIGMFDGVHLAHQEILKQLNQAETSVVITFSNHPLSYLHPKACPCLITPIDLKLSLLKKCHVDLVVVLEFNENIANKEYDDFLEEIRKKIPFNFLILGQGATLGKQRKGTEENIKVYAKKHNVEVHYLKEFVHLKKKVSSSAIRKFLVDGEIEPASQLLGHPFQCMIEQEKITDPQQCVPKSGAYSGSINQQKINFILEKKVVKALNISYDIKKKQLLEFHAKMSLMDGF